MEAAAARETTMPESAVAQPAEAAAAARDPPEFESLVETLLHGGKFVRYEIAGEVLEVTAKYKPPLSLISGCDHATICSLLNTGTGEYVAIKKFADTFNKKANARRMLREIKVLRHMDHENVVVMKDVIPPLNRETFSDVYIAYERMDTDLNQIISSKQTLSEEHFQYFLYQILRGLKYIHSANIIHGNLKPSNLLVNANCDLKISNFGLACTASQTNFETEYVGTRYYHAPELLLDATVCTAAIDVWSVGCTFMELMKGKPLFPGEDRVHQLRLLMELIGTPSKADLVHVNEKARRSIQELPQLPPQSFPKSFPDLHPLAIDLVERMLTFNPSRRITVVDALAHPYLANLHDINDELVCMMPFNFDFEHYALSTEQVKDVIYDEALVSNAEYKLWGVQHSKSELDKVQASITSNLKEKDDVSRVITKNKALSEFREISEPCLIMSQQIEEKLEKAKLEEQTEVATFSYSDLHQATSDFSDSNKLGQGGFGKVYKGNICGNDVAIKMLLSPGDAHQVKAFHQEVDVLGRINHPHLVRLIGHCLEMHALVYEFMPGGTLEARLACNDLPWKDRIRIAVETCSALVFLHSLRPDIVVHGDLKPENVLLDANGKSKLGDFGICRLIRVSNTTATVHHTTVSLRGSIGYLDPLFIQSGRLAPSIDVYAFGMLLLRLLTNKQVGYGLIAEVEEALDEENLDGLLDSAAKWPSHSAQELSHLAIRCCSYHVKKRPRLSDVCKLLEQMKESTA